MPTGYTAGIADGTTADFRTFALTCSRAFGATVMQRDDPMNEPPKHREPTDYHVKAIAEARAEEERLGRLTDDEALVEMLEERTKAEQYAADYAALKDADRSRYEAMLAEVEAWEPPTPDHAELKAFMRQQIEQSINFDCSDYTPAVPPIVTASEWLAEKRAKAARDVAYHSEGNAKEIERCAQANAWIDALYASLSDRGDK